MSVDGKEVNYKNSKEALENGVAMVHQEEMQRLYRLAEARAKELRVRGLRCEIVEEEPFVYARDSIAYKVYVMVWQRRGWNRIVRVEEIKK